MRRHGRYGESPIGGRPDYTWPNGSRLAVYVALGVECYEFGEGMTENLVPGAAPAHDVLNTTWRDYGNRIGAWRVLEAMRALDMPLAILLNSALYEDWPAICAAFRNQGCEIVAHGRSNSDTMAGMKEAEEREYVAGVTAAIARAEGRPPQATVICWIGVWTTSRPGCAPALAGCFPCPTARS